MFSTENYGKFVANIYIEIWEIMMTQELNADQNDENELLFGRFLHGDRPEAPDLLTEIDLRFREVMMEASINGTMMTPAEMNALWKDCYNQFHPIISFLIVSPSEGC